MQTKKLKTFEYAGKVHAGNHEREGLHTHEAFETPSGYVMVMVASSGMTEEDERLVGIAVERVRYYLENADDDLVQDLPGNALKYSSGYLYHHGRKEKDETASGISCLCLIVHEEKIYYARAGGQICMSLWDGKRMHTLLSNVLSKGDAHVPDGETGLFIGQQPYLNPDVVPAPLEPVTNDILLLGTDAVCAYFGKKEAKKILQDSMPLQTKLLRIIGCSGKEASREGTSLMLISFYHLNNQTRSFTSSKPEDTGHKPPSASRDTLLMDSSQRKAKSPVAGILKYLIIILVGVIVGYMVYDLFIYDPRPAIRLPGQLPAAEHDTIVSSPEGDQAAEYDEPPAMPEDVTYTVRGGDTWGRIYRRYSVCSWFIINHPRNTGRLGRDGGLIAGQQLRIPVRYSGDPELNPYYYKEFTGEKVGRSCENAGQEMLDAFHEKYQSR